MGAEGQAPVTATVGETSQGMESVKLSSGWEVLSNTTSASDMAEQLGAKDEKTEAAKTLGKAGAEARKVKPIPPKRAKATDVPEGEDGSNKDTEAVEAIAAADREKETAGLEKDGDKAARDLKAAENERKETKQRELNERFREITRQRRAAEERAAELEREVHALRGGKLPAEAEPKKQLFDTPPDPEKFSTLGEYLDARDKYNRDTWTSEEAEAQKRYEAEAREAEAFEFRKQKIQTTTDGYIKRMGEHFAEGKSPEVEEFISSLPLPSFALEHPSQLTPQHVIVDRIVAAKNPGKIVEFFAENPDEFQRIAALGDPFEIREEVAIIEHRASTAATASTPAARPYTPAHPPVKLATGAPSNAAEALVLTGSESLDEHIRKKQAGARALRR